MYDFMKKVINFKIGDDVVALSSGDCPSQKRTKDSMYTVTDVMYCPTTGEQLININNTKSCVKTGFISCGCGKRHQKDNHFAFTYSKEFASLNDLESLIQEAVAEEDYESAGELNKILEKINDND